MHKERKEQSIQEEAQVNAREGPVFLHEVPASSVESNGNIFPILLASGFCPVEFKPVEEVVEHDDAGEDRHKIEREVAAARRLLEVEISPPHDHVEDNVGKNGQDCNGT